ncbi:GRB10-interacting GYF protein 2-like isoform X1 [Varroa destructor]|uniref:Coiled-coil domain-containing protein n=1 Tax=Varroa destructor TaxID=109461 RepID=A0A7M7MCB3_VARDE|nr:GRB10-interacting GYF protein 2-like isoform X1 [Varroa destructor]XP_022665819.1 GRB10-interacting GYF protein 2-like isoform X1 [Varroa destructor]
MEDGNDHNYRRSKVRQACQNWQILEDEGLAYSLQNEEITEHYDRNRQNSRLVRDDFKTARREQTFEQEMLERSRQQEEAEAEELAAQLALLLDEERQEEDAMRLDEQLARKLAQEDDEAIAREQQDRELARMLQARERVKAKKLREARRRKEEGLSMAFHTVLDAEKHSSEQPEEVLYANLATPLKTQERSHGRNQEYASVSQQPRTQQAAALSDAVHQSSIYLLRNCDVINSTESTTPTHYTVACAPMRRLVTDQPSYRYNRSDEKHIEEHTTAQHYKVGSQSAPSLRRDTHMAVDDGGPSPPYMPMQGIPERAVPECSLRMSRPTHSTINCTNETASKKGISCKTQ